jgi:hypothetical protein
MHEILEIQAITPPNPRSWFSDDNEVMSGTKHIWFSDDFGIHTLPLVQMGSFLL